MANLLPLFVKIRIFFFLFNLIFIYFCRLSLDKIYLDHNATTPIAPEVLERITAVLQNQVGNPSSVHSAGRSAQGSCGRSSRTGSLSHWCFYPQKLFSQAGELKQIIWPSLGVALGLGKTKVVISLQVRWSIRRF